MVSAQFDPTLHALQANLFLILNVKKRKFDTE
jgi:hypothetical protein